MRCTSRRPNTLYLGREKVSECKMQSTKACRVQLMYGRGNCIFTSHAWCFKMKKSCWYFPCFVSKNKEFKSVSESWAICGCCDPSLLYRRQPPATVTSPCSFAEWLATWFIKFGRICSVSAGIRSVNEMSSRRCVGKGPGESVAATPRKRICSSSAGSSSSAACM